MEPENDEEFYVLATRFLSGEATPEESRRLQKRLETPEFKVLFTELKRRWKAARPPSPGDFDVQAAQERLAAQISKLKNPPGKSGPSQSP